MTDEKLENKVEKDWVDTPKAHKLVNYGLVGSFATHFAAKFFRGGRPIKRISGKAMMGLGIVHAYQKRKQILGYFKGLKDRYEAERDAHDGCGGDCDCGDDCDSDKDCGCKYD